jgi:tRNA (Thr-GGU) A37 N-methylase
VTSYEITPIGYVRGGRDQPIDDDWGKSRARIELEPVSFGPAALASLGDFSHLEVVFLFDRVTEAEIEYGARHPRGRADWPLVGIFAQRGKNRPNRLGLCTCRIVGVDGLAVEVEGLDAIDGTPVIDLKPVMREFLPRGEVRQPAWAGELMKDYW